VLDGGRFLIDGNMERGCKPILTIQFMPTSRNSEMLGKPAGPEDNNVQQQRKEYIWELEHNRVSNENATCKRI
jgi:hypothetical protein